MLKPRRRLTKREIKEDKFVTWALRTSGELQEHAKQLVFGVGAVLLVLIIAIAVTQYSKHRSAAAREMLADVDLAKRQRRPSSEIEALYRQVVEQHGSAKAASEALLGLAQAALASGHTQAAREAFDQYLRKHKRTADPLSVQAAWTGLAICFEDEGQYAQAAAHYRRYAAEHPTSPYVPQALLNAARTYRLAGQIDESKQILQQVVQDYPNTSAALQARRQLKVL